MSLRGLYPDKSWPGRPGHPYLLPTRSILIVRIGRLGDFLVALPALVELRRLYPTHRLVLLTGFSSNSSVVRQARTYSGTNMAPWLAWVQPDLVDEVVFFHRWSTPAEWRRLRRRLASTAFEATFVLPYHGERWQNRLKKRLWLYSLGVARPIHDRPDATVARPAGISAQMWAPWSMVLSRSAEAKDRSEPVLPRLRLTDEQGAEAEHLWGEFGLGRKKAIVALFPGATHAHKRWPEERFVSLGRQLQEAFGVHVLVIGSGGEAEAAGRVAGGLHCEAVTNLCGRTSLGGLAAVLARCALFVGNDGGPAHLAAAIGTPCVTLMSGVHSPGVWDPAGKASLAVRVGNLDCLDCRNEKSCPSGHRRCMLDITGEMVLSACAQNLGQQK